MGSSSSALASLPAPTAIALGHFVLHHYCQTQDRQTQHRQIQDRQTQRRSTPSSPALPEQLSPPLPPPAPTNLTQGLPPLTRVSMLRLLQRLGGITWDYGLAMDPTLQPLLARASQLSAPERRRVRTYLQRLYSHNQRFQTVTQPLLRAIHGLPSLGNNPLAIAQLLDQLGNYYFHQLRDRFPDAATLYRQALTLQRRHLGADHPHTLATLNNLALLYDLMGQIEQAEVIYRRLIQHGDRQFGPNSAHLVSHRQNLAFIYFCLGEDAKAEQLYQQVLVHQPDPKTRQEIQLRLVQIYARSQRPAQAESLGLALLADLLHPLSPAPLDPSPSSRTLPPLLRDTVRLLLGLYDPVQQSEEREALYLTLLDQFGGMRFFTRLLDSLQRLGRRYQHQGRYAEAEAQYLQALQLQQRQLGRRDLSVATSWLYLAGLYGQMGYYERAERAYLSALGLQNLHLPANHPNIALSCRQLAQIYHSLGRPMEAVAMEKRAHQIEVQYF